jgi:hypothetical protein
MWDLVNVSGLVAGEYEDAWIIYPYNTTDMTFPLLSFAHGKTAGGDALKPSYVNLLTHTASFGFVVIAPRSCPTNYCADFYKDQLRCIDAVQEGLASPGVNLVDWSRPVGVFGHSMGGAASVISASTDGYGIGAAFFLHPYSDHLRGADKILVPAVHATGSDDKICPSDGVKDGFEANPYHPKVFAEIEGANHLEPNTVGGLWDPFVPRMMMCHLNNDDEACEVIYGSTSQSLCSTDVAMTECLIEM